MKKVTYKKWVPLELVEGAKVKGTSQHEEVYSQEGLFHQWLYNNGQLVAVVEKPDGTVELVIYSALKFTYEL